MDPSINLEGLEKFRQRGRKVEARCPACAETCGDRAGNHFFLDIDTGKFGCAAFPQDKEHRQRIFALVGISQDRPQPTDAEKKAWKQRRDSEERRQKEAASLQRQASRYRETILKQFPWTMADMFHASPIRLLDAPADDWKLLVKLFPPESLLWVGGQFDSGPGKGEPFFFRRESLLEMPRSPGERIAGSTFRHGPSRTAEAVLQHCFVCVEADTAIGFKPETPQDKQANKEASGALVRWLVEQLRWKLRAVVDSGNKSLHAWFSHPGEKAVVELVTVAGAWGVDAGLLRNTAAPLRLPGCIHQKTGLAAQLLYFSPPPHE